MIVDHKNRFIFIAIAKTACTSIQRRFGYTTDPIPSIYHMFLQDVLKKHSELTNYFKFAFVRNPYDRLVSAYHDFRYNEGHKKWAYPIYQYDTFEDFVINLKDSPCMNFIHLKPQFDYVQYNGRIGVDFIGKFESLQNDFYNIESILNINHVPLSIHRESSHNPYESYYNNNTKNIIYNIYERDFQEFGYSK